MFPDSFDGVTDGAFHPLGGGVAALGHRRVEDLGDGPHDLPVIHRQDDGLAQVAVAADMRRHADFQQNVGYNGFQVLLGLFGFFFRTARVAKLPDSFAHRRRTAGLCHVVVGAPGHRQISHVPCGQAGDHQDSRLALQRQAGQSLQDLHAVDAGQDHFHHHHVWLLVLDQVDQLKAVAGLAHHLDVRFLVDLLDEFPAVFLPSVRNEYASFIHIHPPFFEITNNVSQTDMIRKEMTGIFGRYFSLNIAGSARLRQDSTNRRLFIPCLEGVLSNSVEGKKTAPWRL